MVAAGVNSFRFWKIYRSGRACRSEVNGGSPAYIPLQWHAGTEVANVDARQTIEGTEKPNALIHPLDSRPTRMRDERLEPELLLQNSTHRNG
jgi:hypothetical protein